MPSNKDFGRIPVTIVQIDQDLCCKTWQSTNACGTCNSTALTPCFNTFATCQSTPDYNLTDPLTLSFAKPQSDLPDEVYIIPSVTGVTTSPGRINVGGRVGTDKPLGRRAQITVTFQDHPHSDNFTDPYLSSRTYNPLTQGTFWGKWLKRNPYYKGRSLRLYEGYYGQALVEMRTRHYVIDRITLPDSKGNVSLIAKDILTLADNDKAKAPNLSTGKLLAAITAVDVSMIITNAALTDYTAYPTDIVRIGEELIRYTNIVDDGIGNLVFSGLIRGSDETTANTHNIDDTVQACLEYVAQNPADVAYELFNTYGNIDAALIDGAGFTAEAASWLSTFTVTRIIAEPLGVTDLIGEMCEQIGMFLWWDEYAQLIRIKSIHPPDTAVKLLTENDNIIQNSVSLKTDPSQISTEVWISYIPINPIKTKDRLDFKRTIATFDPVLESIYAYNERKVYSINATWLQSEAIINQLQALLLFRYSVAPVILSFALDAKDNDLTIGDVFDIEYGGFVDDTGATEKARFQVISAHEIDGSVVKYEALSFYFATGVNAGFYMIDAAPDYTTATEAERLSGCFWSDDEGAISGDSGYVYS